MHGCMGSCPSAELSSCGVVLISGNFFWLEVVLEWSNPGGELS